jgi:Ca2+-binding RTX toxin-like protein
MATLQQGLQAVAIDLSRFAAKDDFRSLFADVFGDNPGRAAVHGIQNQLLRGDLSRLARVEVIDGAQLGAANAAYASASNTIYLSDRFLARASLGELRAVLLEEFGHAIDARVNLSDRPGDEGELFSLLVRGLTPSAGERQRILADDDRRTLTINGTPVAVELAAPVVYETTSIWSGSGFSSNPASGSVSYEISGINGIWTSQKGVHDRLFFFNGSSVSIIASSIYNPFDTDYENKELDIEKGSVAYIKKQGTFSDIYRFNGSTTTKLTTNSHASQVLIAGNTTVWQTEDPTTGGEIYRSNGTTTTQITNNTGKEEDMQLSGNLLLWSAYDGSDYEIYLNDGTSTRELTNNSLDDYSPVLSGNRAAWLQWNNNQESLFFYDGKTNQQVTSNVSVIDPLIAGNNLVYKQAEPSGDILLRFYDASSKFTRTLSSNLDYNKYDNTDVQVSENLVAWREDRSTLKIFNGSTTTTVATNVDGFALRNGRLFYTTKTGGNYGDNDLFVYDINATSANSMQLTVGEKIVELLDIDFDGEEILAACQIYPSYQTQFKLIQPSTKPILTFSSPTSSVVEGFTTPQTANLNVTLSKASTSPVSVHWETFNDWNDANIDATEGSDYTKSSGVLTFAAGVTNQTISVPILDDTWYEAQETAAEEVFYVRLLDPSNAVLVPGQAKASITISDTWKVTGANGDTFTLPAGVEDLTLLGSSNINGVGNSSRNTIIGNSGNNRLDGKSIADILIGGLGDDTYVSYDNSEGIIENANEGIDTVEFAPESGAGSDYLLNHNVENLILKGSNNLSGQGNSLNNIITGNSGNNLLTDPSGGIDTVSYAPAPSSVVVTLGSGGAWDRGSASGWGDDSLNGFENVIGSRFNDTITGDPGNNELIGGAGSDRLTGGAGSDRLTGGAGADKFVYRVLTDSLLNSRLDIINDFNANVGGDKFLVSTARAGFLNAGVVNELTPSAISAELTSTTFRPRYAASFQVGSGAAMRTYVAINNGSAGFNALTDTLIDVTGVKGTIDASHFVTS